MSQYVACYHATVIPCLSRFKQAIAPLLLRVNTASSRPETRRLPLTVFVSKAIPYKYGMRSLYPFQSDICFYHQNLRARNTCFCMFLFHVHACLLHDRKCFTKSSDQFNERSCLCTTPQAFLGEVFVYLSRDDFSLP